MSSVQTNTISNSTSIPSTYWLARFAFLRALAAVYFVAFTSYVLQVLPLLGADGLLPITGFLQEARTAGYSPWNFPSLFWLNSSDGILLAAGWLGVGLSLLALFGLNRAAVFLVLWILYLSIVNVGQIFYGYGWESLLLEAGFLAIFLAPFRRSNLFDPNSPPSPFLMMFLWWVLFRVLFGAGVIKLRAGDSCWVDFTCLNFHFETQPIPNRASWYLNALPQPLLKFGVGINHLTELIIPWFLFAPRRLRHFGASFAIFFQLMLIVSGNLSWLNYITIAVALACFDDRAFGRLASPKTRELIRELGVGSPPKIRRVITRVAICALLLLSIPPALNLLSPHQLMNAAFEPFHIVNTYGAFGVVGRERKEIVLEGTSDEKITAQTVWQPYEFRYKPGDIFRAPPLIAPFQPRLDWQIWFAAMSNFQSQPWLQRLVVKLLEGDQAVATLLATNPFPKTPPRYIRGELYWYRFTRPSEKFRSWWRRNRLPPYFPPVSLKPPSPTTSPSDGDA